MKYGLIVAISFLVISLGYNYYQNVEVGKLNCRITALQSHSDTIFVEGTKDTVVITKWLKKTYTVEKIVNKEIDTAFADEYHIVSVKTSPNDVMVDIQCGRPELEITKRDTVKIPYMVEVEVPAKPIPFYQSKEMWFGYGATVAIIITKILSK